MLNIGTYPGGLWYHKSECSFLTQRENGGRCLKLTVFLLRCIEFVMDKCSSHLRLCTCTALTGLFLFLLVTCFVNQVKVLWSPQYADEQTQHFIVIKRLLMTAYLLTQQLNKI